MRCSMTGQPLRDTSDGIYDDGEWISWDWINGHIADRELRGEFPNANLQVVKIFQDLVALAVERLRGNGALGAALRDQTLYG